jgi:rod shape determining protein RodA
MIKKLLKKIDYRIIIVIFILFGIGAVGLYSASHGAGGNSDEFTKQMIWFAVGVVCMMAITFFDYKHLKKIWIIVYIVFLALLVGVLFSNRNHGATSWYKIGIFSFQPSEFFKIVLIIGLSSLIAYFHEKEAINKITSLILLLIILAIPSFLIIKQPDYGTALVMIFTFCIMLFIADINIKYIVAGVIVAIIALPLAYHFVLPDHAKTRIMVFINPELDPKGAGYNVIQSKLAVGSGMATGMGLLNGNQTQMGMLPMKTTDFIYSVISEEMGFFVSALIVLLYIILLYRILKVAHLAKDMFGKMICIGAFAMILAHVVENIGMTMGLMPITGIPLPFISYGGSSMLTNFIAIGLVQSVNVRIKNFGL